jgi:RNA polymerase sigma-70 factor (family 1)
MMRDYDNYTDEELIKLLSKSDLQAFDLVYSRNWYHLYQSAYYILKDTESSKDIVQDVFVWLWEHRLTVSIDNVKAYLKAAVRFKATNYIRSGKIRQSFFDELSNFQDTSLPTADELIEFKQLALFIQQIINELPEKCREIYRLSRDEYLTNKEIAERLNISVKTVENQMTIALKRIRAKAGLYVIWVVIVESLF